MNDPRARLGLVLLVGVLAVCLDSPGALLALFAVCLVPVLALRPSLRRVGQGALTLLGIVWSTVLSQGIFYSDEPRVALFSVGPLTLWREGAAHGLVQSLRFCAVSLAGLALAISTSPERLHAALVALRVPFGLAFLVVTGLRFVPDALEEWAAVRRARARRGAPAWKRSPWAWMALETAMLGPVIARSMRRGRALAESLDARGFDASAPRALRRPLRISAGEIGVVAVGAMFTMAIAGSRILFALYVTETWYHPSLRPLYVLVRGSG